MPWRTSGTHLLRSVAELYVPFTLFRVTMRRRDACDSRLLAVDRFCGKFDPFTFDEVPQGPALMLLETRNRLDHVLSEDQAAKELTTKLQRMLFQKGFFKVDNAQCHLSPVADFYMPYWLGFFGSGARASLKIIDATRGVYEGNKLRNAVEEWLCR